MTRSFCFFAILVIILTVSGCSTLSEKPSSKNAITVSQHKVNLHDDKIVRKKLYAQYRQWQGTKYAMGGLGKNGIDCSGFVYVTYRQQFGITLPRTTAYQSQIGQSIKRNQLRPGDLVFFKTGFKVRHVGIYLGDKQFLHASSKKGVMISKLNDYYWKGKYLYARRVVS